MPLAQADDHASVLGSYVGAFVDGLVQAGVRHACACPGSRSTPLLLVLRRHPSIRLWMHLDERSAAFFALGIAKASGEPVALVSTSGTAALNFAPAVAEARQGRVPLLALTADRPPELRGVGANQTVDQIGLYGSHVKRFLELALPEGGASMRRYAALTAARAAALSAATPAGPVHINLPFREPLLPAPVADPTLVADEAGDVPLDLAIIHSERRPSPAEANALLARLTSNQGAKRGLIVCGPQSDPGLPAAVAALSAALAMPILADPLSQVRCGPHARASVIDGYDAFLRDPEVTEALRPQIVLRFGSTPTSKPLLEFLDDPSIGQIVVTDEDGWNDPSLAAAAAVHADPRSVCDVLVAACGSGEAGAGAIAWAERWRLVADATREALQEELADESRLSEPQAAARIAAALPDGATLFAGNSLPVRDIDGFFPSGPANIHFLGNRGVSGIDGVVSTALGAAAVGDGPLVLAIGDLSLYHDMNGLLAAREHGLSATIVLLNNGGGGIFSFLPQADGVEHFEELFGSPHGLDFSRVAKLYGLDYTRAEDAVAFDAALAASLRSPGLQLIEVPSERDENVRLHRRLWSVAGERAREALASPART